MNNKQRLPYTLLAGQIIAMLSTVSMFLYATDWQWAITGIMYFGIMSFGITMGYHRYLSHRAFKCPLWFEYVMVFFAHIMMVGPAIVWVANHREHHKYADTHLDPHSPHYKGWLSAYFLQVLTDIDFKLCRDLLRIDRYRMQVKYYWHFIAVWAVILFLIDPFAVVYAWLAPAGFGKLIGSLVFTYSHRGKKANSDTWLGLITFGEGFHEIHHVKPRKVLFHPLDISGHIIRVIDKNART